MEGNAIWSAPLDHDKATHNKEPKASALVHTFSSSSAAVAYPPSHPLPPSRGNIRWKQNAEGCTSYVSHNRLLYSGQRLLQSLKRSKIVHVINVYLPGWWNGAWQGQDKSWDEGRKRWLLRNPFALFFCSTQEKETRSSQPPTHHSILCEVEIVPPFTGTVRKHLKCLFITVAIPRQVLTI